MAYVSGSSGQMTSGAQDKTETNKALYWIARLCASLECDMFDNKKLAQEDKNHLALMLCLRSLILSK
ncbi:hypothetical protein E2119_12225 [Escherichia coli]|nr:hypothetical protein E2119_12225 [Escherichia coli]